MVALSMIDVRKINKILSSNARIPVGISLENLSTTDKSVKFELSNLNRSTILQPSYMYKYKYEFPSNDQLAQILTATTVTVSRFG